MTAKKISPPCGASCPNRTPTCRKDCEAFQKYDEERLADDAKKQGVYNRNSANTIGGERRYTRNLLWKAKKSRGDIS